MATVDTSLVANAVESVSQNNRLGFRMGGGIFDKVVGLFVGVMQSDIVQTRLNATTGAAKDVALRSMSDYIQKGIAAKVDEILSLEDCPAIFAKLRDNAIARAVLFFVIGQLGGLVFDHLDRHYLSLGRERNAKVCRILGKVFTYMAVSSAASASKLDDLLTAVSGLLFGPNEFGNKLKELVDAEEAA